MELNNRLALLKRTFVLDKLPVQFWRSEFRDQFVDDLMLNGAFKVKRVGDSSRQRLFVSYLEDRRTDSELLEMIEVIMTAHGLNNF